MTQRIDELTLGSVNSALWQATLCGIVLVMFQNENLIGFFKTYTNEFCRQTHVHSNLTIMIDPTSVRQGFGTELWVACENALLKSFPHIIVTEILPHDSNMDAIKLYNRMGYVTEAKLPKKIWYTDGSFGDQVVLYKMNLNFCEQSLLKYQKYLRNLLHETHDYA
ncbi:unnamed protein product [Rotaria socialis]|uniref:N-acetyltransferase domain-containing protein n=1 Tax=Rotaria socialis TaxID=392032 RepID=A0A820XF28_9BILA|nr:unnamed protein product [Rotaria socialis]CAF3387791.1 unnamed protein product [Rotaria socialis]CAF3774002.1 unnamed protein product [Rotaria socialis]CAF4480340.1 unnamed protein product [Rotaria socialis]CAF4527639.1 unnamed protein product [Rotaria socialis]